MRSDARLHFEPRQRSRPQGREPVTLRWLGALVALAVSSWLFGATGWQLYLLIVAWVLFTAVRAYEVSGERRYLLAALLPPLAGAVAWVVDDRSGALATTLLAVPATLLVLAMMWMSRSDAMPTRCGRLSVRLGAAVALWTMVGPLIHPRTWQSATPASISAMQGCYRPTPSPFGYPHVVVLDSMRWTPPEKGAPRNFARSVVSGARQLTPEWRGLTGSWREAGAHGIDVNWTQGHMGYRGLLRRDGDDLVGRVQYYQDSPGPPRLFMPLRLRRVSC